MTVVAGAEFAEREHRGEHRGRPGHVVFHRGVHRVGRLEAHAAGVVRDALRDERQVGRTAAGLPVHQLDHPRLVGAAAVDADQAAAAEPYQVVPVEDLHAEAGPRAEHGGDVRYPGRGEVRGRCVGEVPRQHRRLGKRQAAAGARRHRVAVRLLGEQRDRPDWRRRGVSLERGL